VDKIKFDTRKILQQVKHLRNINKHQQHLHVTTKTSQTSSTYIKLHHHTTYLNIKASAYNITNIKTIKHQNNIINITTYISNNKIKPIQINNTTNHKKQSTHGPPTEGVTSCRMQHTHGQTFKLQRKPKPSTRRWHWARPP